MPTYKWCSMLCKIILVSCLHISSNRHGEVAEWNAQQVQLDLPKAVALWQHKSFVQQRLTSRHCMGGMRSLPRPPEPWTFRQTLLTPPSRPQSVYSVMGARSCTIGEMCR